MNRILAQQQEQQQEKEQQALSLQWQKAGLPIKSNVTIVTIYNHPEYTYAVAKKWHDAGWTDGDVVVSWLEAGCTDPVKAKEWYKVDSDPINARGWYDTGFNLDAAQQWESKGYNFNDAKRWNNAGFSLTDVTEWVDAGWTNGDAILLWHDGGFNPTEAGKWYAMFHKINYHHFKKETNPTDTAIFWSVPTGTEPYDARVERHDEAVAGTQNLISEAKEWKEDGFTIEDAQQWHDGDFQPDTAKAWKDAGWNLANAREWRSLDNSLNDNPVGAREWLKAGYTAKEAGTWVDNYNPYYTGGISLSSLLTIAKKLRRTCGKILHSTADLVDTNPYDVEHKCYLFSGSLLQLLSRTRGLYDIGYKPFYLDFGSSSAPARGFIGIVEGIGVYSYRNTLKVLVVTSKLRAVRY